MSKTPDVDEAISKLQTKLDETQDTKAYLQIMDRLYKLFSLKYKYGAEGKGSKFTRPVQPAKPPGGDGSG